MERPEIYTAGTATLPATTPRFVEVRTRKNKLLFRFNPKRLLIEWCHGDEYELIDLTEYME
jgi:hypothetical protein